LLRFVLSKPGVINKFISLIEAGENPGDEAGENPGEGAGEKLFKVELLEAGEKLDFEEGGGFDLFLGFSVSFIFGKGNFTRLV
jgi:hypothetical protein